MTNPAELTKLQIDVLKRLMYSSTSRFTLRLRHKATQCTLDSLVAAGYIEQPNPWWYAITLAGREALARWADAQIPAPPPDSPNYGGGRL